MATILSSVAAFYSFAFMIYLLTKYLIYKANWCKIKTLAVACLKLNIILLVYVVNWHDVSTRCRNT